MKHYNKLILILALGSLAGILVFLFFGLSVMNGPSDQSAAVLSLNEIAHDAADRWEDLSSLQTKDYGVSYVILDPANNVLYKAAEEKGSQERYSVERAIRMRWPYAYVERDGVIAGSVILPDDGIGALRSLWLKLGILLSLMLLLFLLAMFVYGIYVKKTILIPFQNLKDFAGRVAEGNLEEPLTMDRGNLFGAFTESFDIMREELENSRKREIELQKKERELVASLSHDLKTPITGIKLTTELLKAKPDAKDLPAKLDNIYQKADQIDHLVTDLFTSTLDDLGEIKVTCSDEEAKVLSDIVRKYDDRELAGAFEVPCVLIRIDRKRMSQVIGNIIANSYKYADTPIDIACRVADGFLEMRIEDHGPGVPEEELDLITNKFYRGRKREEDGKEGSGLGLYIARTLMEKMKGELIPENTGDGFCIVLMIPLSR